MQEEYMLVAGNKVSTQELYFMGELILKKGVRVESAHYKQENGISVRTYEQCGEIVNGYHIYRQFHGKKEREKACEEVREFVSLLNRCSGGIVAKTATTQMPKEWCNSRGYGTWDFDVIAGTALHLYIRAGVEEYARRMVKQAIYTLYPDF